MKYIITQAQVDRLRHGDDTEIVDTLAELKTIEPLTDALSEKIWHELDGKKIIQGETSFIWNRLIRSAYARAIESAITGRQA